MDRDLRNDFEGASYIMHDCEVIAIVLPGKYRIMVNMSETSETKVHYNLSVLAIENGEITSKQDYAGMTISRGERTSTLLNF